MREAIRLRRRSRSTEKSYVAWVRRYILFHRKRHPAEMGTPEVTRFLSSLALQGNCTHVLNRGPSGVASPADRVLDP